MVEIEVKGSFDSALEKKFKADIQGLKKGDVLLINITSVGGEVDTLKAMATDVYSLKQKGVTVATFVPEYAYSCGFLFFLLGDHREMDLKAKALYHEPRFVLNEGTTLTANDIEDLVSDMAPYKKFCTDLFRSSCDISDDMFSLIERSEMPLNRQNLITLGIIN